MRGSIGWRFTAASTLIVIAGLASGATRCANAGFARREMSVNTEKAFLNTARSSRPRLPRSRDLPHTVAKFVDMCGFDFCNTRGDGRVGVGEGAQSEDGARVIQTRAQCREVLRADERADGDRGISGECAESGGGADRVHGGAQLGD